MEDLKRLIEKNLILRVDFNNSVEQTEHGDIIGTKYFLIGVVQVAVFYQDGTNERALINYALSVAKDPFLRLLQGVKATDRMKIKNYNQKVKEIVRGLEGAILKTVRDGKFNNREISKILIVKYANRTNDTTRGDQAIREECQKACEQAGQTDS
ncbi:MAG: hypothetical protein WCG01_02440 [bacterium]